jgi:hypothetical protein
MGDSMIKAAERIVKREARVAAKAKHMGDPVSG